MRKLGILLGLAVGIVAGLNAVPAHAGSVVYTFTGTAFGIDHAGVLGAPNSFFAGTPFTATYTWTPSIPPFYLNQSAFVGDVYGGSDYGTSQIITARFSIAGRDFDLGSAGGQVAKVNGLGSPSLGLGNDNILGSAANRAGFFQTGLYTPLSSSDQDFISDVNLISAFSASNVGTPVFQGFFVLDREVAASIPNVRLEAVLDVTGVNVTSFGNIVLAPAIPEPQTWLLMLAGFGLVGTAMRRSPKPAPASR